jgi:hypothetical protein
VSDRAGGVQNARSCQFGLHYAQTAQVLAVA